MALNGRNGLPVNCGELELLWLQPDLRGHGSDSLNSYPITDRNAPVRSPY